MAVYVDDAKNKYGRMIMCHMLADSLEELHEMADRIGVSRHWYQHKNVPHYDVCKTKRALAVRYGAQEIQRGKVIELVEKFRTADDKSEQGTIMSEVTLHLGDCLEYMKTMEAGSVDAVVTDPPYGIGESGKKNASRQQKAKPIDYGLYCWDIKITPEHLHEVRRVSQEQVIFGGNYYADQLPPSSSWIVWDKMNSGDFADCELAWTSHKKAVRKFTYMWNGFIKQKPEKRYHPTQKPLDLMKWILENYTKPGDTIFDPFMGSGTTGVACVQLGRNFIGCEIDPGYFAIAEKRIKEAQMQLRLGI